MNRRIFLKTAIAVAIGSNVVNFDDMTAVAKEKPKEMTKGRSVSYVILDDPMYDPKTMTEVMMMQRYDSWHLMNLHSKILGDLK